MSDQDSHIHTIRRADVAAHANEYDTVYVVVPNDGSEDPAAFALFADADNYAAAIDFGRTVTIHTLLVCEGELAAKMIREAEGVEE